MGRADPTATRWKCQKEELDAGVGHARETAYIGWGDAGAEPRRKGKGSPFRVVSMASM